MYDIIGVGDVDSVRDGYFWEFEDVWMCFKVVGMVRVFYDY